MTADHQSRIAPIIDTSVLIDVFLTSAERHAQAKQLGELIISRGERVPFPVHGLFGEYLW